MNLLDKAIRSQFVQYFPNPESLKKRKNTGKESQQKELENPYKSITRWFDAGNTVDVFLNVQVKEKQAKLYKVIGLNALVKKFFRKPNELKKALLRKFVLMELVSNWSLSKRISKIK